MITWGEAKEVARVLECAEELQLPPRVTCLRCGTIFPPTETTGIRFNARFGVFFFYCEEHDHETP